MKKLLIVVISIITLVSCSKDKTAGIKIPADIDTAANSMSVKYKGAFVSTSGITVKGTAKIILKGTQYTLLLDSFQISTGPDLKVYLSKKDTPSDFINLGALRSNTGDDVYDIQVPVDFSMYKYVLIHCQQFNHLFAIEMLNP